MLLSTFYIWGVEPQGNQTCCPQSPRKSVVEQGTEPRSPIYTNKCAILTPLPSDQPWHHPASFVAAPYLCFPNYTDSSPRQEPKEDAPVSPPHPHPYTLQGACYYWGTAASLEKKQTLFFKFKPGLERFTQVLLPL